MEAFGLCFIPLFVAVDAIGLLPVFVGLTAPVTDKQRAAIIGQSVLTAAAVALLFLNFGPALFGFLGLAVTDVMLAGGILLLALSLRDLLDNATSRQVLDADSIGAVPIGVPLISGPAVLTTSIVLAGIHGVMVTGVALVANIILAGLLFQCAPAITRLLGTAGTRAISKVSNMLLAAIAVMLMRRALVAVVQELR